MFSHKFYGVLGGFFCFWLVFCGWGFFFLEMLFILWTSTYCVSRSVSRGEVNATWGLGERQLLRVFEGIKLVTNVIENSSVCICRAQLRFCWCDKSRSKQHRWRRRQDILFFHWGVCGVWICWKIDDSKNS